MKYLMLYSALFVGVFIGVRLPQGLFRPWYDDGKFYGGEKVHHTQEDKDIGDFYNACEYGKVVYVHDQYHILVEWHNCEKLEELEYRKGFFDLHSHEYLVKDSK